MHIIDFLPISDKLIYTVINKFVRPPPDVRFTPQLPCGVKAQHYSLCFWLLLIGMAVGEILSIPVLLTILLIDPTPQRFPY